MTAIALAILAAGAGVFIWQTRWKSRTTLPVDESARKVVRPADLPGLGYLPPSTDVVLAIQVPFLLEKLGPDAQADPGKALERLGLLEVVVNAIEKASGVGLKNVEQLVVGLGLQNTSLPPQVCIVVVTRQSFDFADLIRKTKANALKKDGRTLQVARITGAFNLPLDVHWWSPNERVLVATLQAGDYDNIPLVPRIGIEHFRAEVASLIRDRVAEDSCAWLVASSDNWRRHIEPYVFLGIPPFQGRRDLLAPADRLRSIVVAIPNPVDQPVNFEIDFKTGAAAEELRSNLRERFAGEPIEVSGERETCRVQTAFAPARIGSILSRMLQKQK